MTVGSFLTKAIGAYSLYLSAKDTNRFGKAFKNKNPQAKIAESFPDMYINTQRIELSKTVLPTIVCDAKKGYFDYYLRDTLFPFWHGLTGYVAGICTGIVHNIVPIVLGIGALAFSKSGVKREITDPKTGKIIKAMCEKVKDPATGAYIYKKVPFLKRVPGKICAGILLLGALKSILTNVCGFGDYRKL